AAHRERRRGGEPRRERALRVGAARVERGDDEHSGYGMKAHRVSSRGAPGHSPAAGGYGGSRDRRSVGKRRWSDGERPHARTQSAWRREDVCRFGTRQPPSPWSLEFHLRPAGERRLMNSVFASAVWLFGYAFLSNVALAVLPHAPVVIWYGAPHRVWATALLATAGTGAAAALRPARVARRQRAAPSLALRRVVRAPLGPLAPDRLVASVDARRELTFLLAEPERRLLRAIAVRLPAWVTSDRLTLLGVVGALGAGVAYALSGLSPAWLWAASALLLVNWFGDSLDGT